MRQPQQRPLYVQQNAPVSGILPGSRWNKRQIRYLWYRTPGTFTDIAVKGQDVDHRQGVTFTDFIVVKVVRRGDLHAAGAFFHVGVFVANDRNTTVNQRQNDIFANQIFVTRIFR